MSYFTSLETFFVVPLNCSDEEIQKIDFLLMILEKSGVGKLIEEAEYKSSKYGRKPYDPYKLFAAVIYCFTVHKGTLRNCEEMIRYDLRLNYILAQETPSYKTIMEFINEIIVPSACLIFTKITSAIIKHLNIDVSDQYLDGTKIEANANKYKFVYKPRKHWERLDANIKNLFSMFDETYTPEKERITSVELSLRLKNYAEKEEVDIYNIPSGKGIRLAKAQKLIKLGYKYLDKLLEYEEKNIICGPNRNSYYKTDKDATAMALKTDYYSGHGSNMHAAYNVQFLVSSGFITFFGVFQDRTDYYTLIPLLDKYELYYGNYPVNLCADSGYGVYSNYDYLARHGINNYVKHLGWNGESSGKNPQRFFLNEKENGFICLNGNHGKKIPFDSRHHQKKKHSGLYCFEGCLNCPYEYKCRDKIKNRYTDIRLAELSVKEEKYKKQTRDNLLSIRGIEIRVNRSIRAEGAFGEMKQNMGFVRLRRRGMKKVTAEIMLMCLGINIRKLFSVYKKEKISNQYWKSKEDTSPQVFPQVRPKKKG